MTPVAAIVFSAHDRAFLRAVEATDALVYTLTREGSLKALRGPSVAAVGNIPAGHVVWVGVPKPWVDKLGAQRFKSHFSSGTRSWRRSKDPSAAVQTIQEAFAARESEGQAVAEARAEAQEQSRLRVESAVFQQPQPWYIPQELR